MHNNISKHHRSVLFISDLDIWSMGQNKGGPALSRTLLAYAEQGWEVVFITGNENDSRQEITGIRLLRFDAPWLKQFFGIRRLGAIARALWWLYFQVFVFAHATKLQNQHDFDVVYGYEIMGVPIAKLLSLLWHIPMVARFQGTSFGVGWSEGWIKYLRAWDHWVALRIPADLIIMTNDGTQGDQVLQQCGANMSKVRFWMNGVDKDAYLNLPSRQEARNQLGLMDAKIILTVSRLICWKCVDRSIKALPAVLDEYPDVSLVIVGEGNEMQNLIQLVDDLKLTDNVKFIGSVPHGEVKLFMAAADLFLSLYTWSNVGNPLLEAMLAGKPIITVKNGDTAKFIEHEITGILLNEDNLSPLPMTIKALLRDQRQCEKLGNNARNYALHSFPTWEERLTKEIKEVGNLLLRESLTVGKQI